MPEQMMQYGSMGAIGAVVMVVVPIVRSMIEQQKRTFDILRESLDQNAQTIAQLKDMEAGSVRSRQALAETQTEILASLRDLERTLASKGRQSDKVH